MKISSDLINEIEKIEGLRVSLDRDLSKFSTMKLQSFGSLIEVSSKEALSKLLIILNQKKIPYRPIGWGANFILPKEPSYLLILLSFPFDKKMVNLEQKEFHLPASTPLNVLTSLATKYGFRGWEVFTGIPGSLGGAVFMNAGTSLGEIGSLVKSVQVMQTDGKIREVIIDENSFSYRKNYFVNEGEVVVEVVMLHNGLDPNIKNVIKDYLKMRNDTQPLRAKTCGCMFKNQGLSVSGQDLICRTGLFIDILGLKGLGVDGLKVSSLHANFMENFGESSENEVRKLVSLILDELNLAYGVRFETEVHLF